MLVDLQRKSILFKKKNHGSFISMLLLWLHGIFISVMVWHCNVQLQWTQSSPANI